MTFFIHTIWRQVLRWIEPIVSTSPTISRLLNSKMPSLLSARPFVWIMELEPKCSRLTVLLFHTIVNCTESSLLHIGMIWWHQSCQTPKNLNCLFLLSSLLSAILYQIQVHHRWPLLQCRCLGKQRHLSIECLVNHGSEQPDHCTLYNFEYLSTHHRRVTTQQLLQKKPSTKKTIRF